MATIAQARKWSRDERGVNKMGWLDAKHTFSFGRFYDPTRMGVGPLRVLNDDIFGPGGGFDTHPHDNMEIFTYVLSGRLAHRDSTGTSEEIGRGQLQFMSAGSGVTHSEFNASQTEPVHLLQIWIEPNQMNLAPRYEERTWADDDKRGRLLLMLSPDGRDGSLTISQDTFVYASILRTGESLNLSIAEGRIGFLHVAQGEVTAGDEKLLAGDSLEWHGGELPVTTDATGEILFFDLPRNSGTY